MLEQGEDLVSSVDGELECGEGVSHGGLLVGEWNGHPKVGQTAGVKADPALRRVTSLASLALRPAGWSATIDRPTPSPPSVHQRSVSGSAAQVRGRGSGQSPCQLPMSVTKATASDTATATATASDTATATASDTASDTATAAATAPHPRKVQERLFCHPIELRPLFRSGMICLPGGERAPGISTGPGVI